MKRQSWITLFKVGALLMILGIVGLLVAASGIIPIKASSGHWAITAWLLEFSMRRSVATHTLGTDSPALDEPWLVLKGAGHYETACRPCHGSPGLERPVTVQAMTPAPPYLPPDIANWQPEELFYIVKHGVKFTGMPAWPTLERDDEVRAMVAFLLALPKLDAEQYRRLVFGDTSANESTMALRNFPELQHAPRAPFATCARCHGVDGLSRGSAAFPKLAGQRREYLFGALEAYARGARPSGIMQPVAYALTRDQKGALADYFSSLTGAALDEPSAESSDSAAAPSVANVESGREIASRGVPRVGVPSCRDCHGPGPGNRNPAYPRLAGQYADYIVLQLELFKSGRRGGSSYAHIMRHVANRLSPEQMRAVALYYASLTSEGDRLGR
jgi:cytochrome c553